MKSRRFQNAKKKRPADGGLSITRRDVLAGATLASAALAGGLIPASAIQAAPQAASKAVGAAAKTGPAFSPDQRRILEAFIDRIIPRDENGPGAVESGAADYIDRSFVEFLTGEKDSFAAGLAAVDAFARSSQGAPFADLSPEKRDAVLTAIDDGHANQLRPFFNRARRLTLEGMFCDPYWGGNKNFAGWDLIRYPGIRLSVTAEDQKMSKPAATLHKSAYASNGEQNHGH
jgi:gluconate 2-dehydrogenase gamma chain